MDPENHWNINCPKGGKTTSHRIDSAALLFGRVFPCVSYDWEKTKDKSVQNLVVTLLCD